MLRKAQLLSAGLLIATSTCQAGFYAGLGLGPDRVDFRQAAHVVHINPAHPDENLNVHDNTHLSGTGIFGTLFAGYGWLHGQYYLAGEVNGNFSSVAFKSSNAEENHHSYSSTRYKINNEWGASVLPGFQLLPETLVYGRLGYANGQFKVVTSDTSLANVSKRRNGFRWGLGAKEALTQRVAVRMEYSQTVYSSTQFSTFDAASAFGKTTKIRPFQQLVEFGLVVNFS